MPISEAKRRNNANYTAKCDKMLIQPLKEEGQVIRAAAKAAGQSLQGYVLQAVRERLARENSTVIDSASTSSTTDSGS